MEFCILGPFCFGEALSHYFYIKKPWLTSSGGRRFWRNCAWVSLLLMAWPFWYAFFGDWLYEYQMLDILGRLLLLISAVALAANMAAMENYLFTLDDSSALAQIFWFVVLLLPPIGPAFYCLVVYSRSKYFKDESSESSQPASVQ